MSEEEGMPIKLVYEFLSYQPRLSENSFEYTTVHEMRVVRDPDCDETLPQMTSGVVGDWRQAESGLRYSKDAPSLPDRRGPLLCCITTPEDHVRTSRESPAGEGHPSSLPKLTQPPQ